MPPNTVDACLFCGVVHSGNCGGTPPKPKISKVERVRATPKTSPAAPSLATAQAAAPGEVGAVTPAPAREKTRPNLASVQRVRDPEEEQLAYAITLFAERDMLGADSLREHRKYVRLPGHTIDAMIWKEENRDRVVRNESEPPDKTVLPPGVREASRDRASPGLP